MKKIRVGLLFGGRSGEHEVSLASAASVLAALDPSKYDAVAIGITREGHWLMSDSPAQLLKGEVTLELSETTEALPDVSHHGIVRVNEGGGIDLHQTAVDVVFPLLHGPYGEDGTVQGLLELADIPYVGSGVLGSALSMDKWAMKNILRDAGLPVGPYRGCTKRAWACHRDNTLRSLEDSLEYPMFVKPCNLGSSVGISKAHDREELEGAFDLAVRYDRRVIVEQGIAGRELECGVLGNDEPLVSVIGEVRSHHEFYDYDTKYTEGLADLIIPADVSADATKTVQALAREAFLAVDASGLARVDFFIRAGDGTVLVNEINTIPGFTTTSMYPKLWEATGMSYSDLVDTLIQLAIDRHGEKSDRAVTR